MDPDSFLTIRQEFFIYTFHFLVTRITPEPTSGCDSVACLERSYVGSGETDVHTAADVRSKDKNKQGTTIAAVAAMAAATTTSSNEGSYFEDPDGICMLPTSLASQVHKWIRPHEFIKDKMPVVVDSSGLDHFDLTSMSTRVHMSELMRFIIAEVTTLSYLQDQSTALHAAQPALQSNSNTNLKKTLMPKNKQKNKNKSNKNTNDSNDASENVDSDADNNNYSKKNEMSFNSVEDEVDDYDDDNKDAQFNNSSNNNNNFNNSSQIWRPWNHIYSSPGVAPQAATKGGKQTAVTPMVGGPGGVWTSASIPSYNKYGKYCIKLYWMGNWRKITIDDLLPVDANCNLLLPSTMLQHELWPMLLSKALVKIAALDYPATIREWEFGDFSVVQCLTGWLPELLPIRSSNLNEVWSMLKKELDEFKLPPSAEEVAAAEAALATATAAVESLPANDSPEKNRSKSKMDKTRSTAKVRNFFIVSNIAAAVSQFHIMLTICDLNVRMAVIVYDLWMPEIKKFFEVVVEEKKSDLPPAKPEVIVMGLYQGTAKPLFTKSEKNELQDKYFLLSEYGLVPDLSHPLLLTQTRSVPLEPPPAIQSIPAWKMLRPRYEDCEANDKPIQCVRISSAFVNNETEYAALNQQMKQTLEKALVSNVTSVATTPTNTSAADISENKGPQLLKKFSPGSKKFAIQVHMRLFRGKIVLNAALTQEEKSSRSPSPSKDRKKSLAGVKSSRSRQDLKKKTKKGDEETGAATDVPQLPKLPTTRSFWMDFDVFARCFKFVKVYHKPETYPFSEKLTDEHMSTAMSKSGTSVPSSVPNNTLSVQNKSEKSKVPRPPSQDADSPPTICNPKYLYVDLNEQANVIINFTCFSQWIYPLPSLSAHFPMRNSSASDSNRAAVASAEKHRRSACGSVVNELGGMVVTGGHFDANEGFFRGEHQSADEQATHDITADVIGHRGNGDGVDNRTDKHEERKTISGKSEVRQKVRTNVPHSDMVFMVDDVDGDGGVYIANDCDNDEIMPEECCVDHEASKLRAGVLNIYKYTWRDVVADCPIMKIKTTGSFSNVLALQPGRQVLQLHMSSPHIWHVHTCSNISLSLLDEHEAISKLMEDSLTLKAYAAGTMKCMSEMFLNFGGYEKYQVSFNHFIFKVLLCRADLSLSYKRQDQSFKEAFYMAMKDCDRQQKLSEQQLQQLKPSEQQQKPQQQQHQQQQQQPPTTTQSELVHFISREMNYALRVLFFDVITPNPLGVEYECNTILSSGDQTAKQSAQSNEKGQTTPNSKKAQNKKNLQASSSTEQKSMEEKLKLNRWTNREPTLAEHQAATKVQQHWRGHFFRKIVNFRAMPLITITGLKQKKHYESVKQMAMKLSTFLRNNSLPFGLCFFKHLFKLYPDWLMSFPFCVDEVDKVVVQEYEGVAGDEEDEDDVEGWRDIFHAPTDNMIFLPKLFVTPSSAPPSSQTPPNPVIRVRVINNDTNCEMPKLLGDVAAQRYFKNKLATTLFARPGLFYNDLNTAIFWELGNVDVCKHLLTRFNKNGRSVSTNSTKKNVGIGPRQHVILEENKMIVFKSALEFGYTIVGETCKCLKKNKWKLKLIGSPATGILEKPNEDDIKKQFDVHEIIQYHCPVKKFVFRYKLTVTQNQVISFSFKASNPCALVELRIFDDDCLKWSSHALGSIVVPAFHFLAEEPPTIFQTVLPTRHPTTSVAEAADGKEADDAADDDEGGGAEVQNVATEKNDTHPPNKDQNDNSPNTNKSNKDGRDDGDDVRKVDDDKQLTTMLKDFGEAVEDFSFLYPMPVCNFKNAHKEKLFTSKSTIHKIIVTQFFLDIVLKKRHLYRVEAKVRNDSWPLNRPQWKFVVAYNEQERKKEIAAVTPKSTVEINGQQRKSQQERSPTRTHSTSKLNKSAGKSSKVSASSSSASSLASNDSKLIKEKLDLTKPHWVLKLFKDKDLPSDSVHFVKNSDDEDRLKEWKDSWELRDPGRKARAQQSRRDYLCTHLAKRETEEERAKCYSNVCDEDFTVPTMAGIISQVNKMSGAGDDEYSMEPPDVQQTTADYVPQMDLKPFMRKIGEDVKILDDQTLNDQICDIHMQCLQFNKYQECIEYWRDHEKLRRGELVKNIEDFYANMQKKLEESFKLSTVARNNYREKQLEAERIKKEEEEKKAVVVPEVESKKSVKKKESRMSRMKR
ncbi:hypothetical protein HELRODRAFT_188534 [Helobdella robusta]|uniref:Uncharacterized protein n=1 Tax=Helobdella robusta TaxID=6412 RepID=T1FQ38_HELRO|nr:hypothetical protein HELRODRAFT_188534 [Helobdella robusta]ESO01968.1 hypothetical protein HELRODRAFT_188534 [Helobdella robusta]